MGFTQVGRPTLSNVNNEINMTKIKYIAAVVIALAGFGLQQAKADFISRLTNGDPSLNRVGFHGSYAFIVVHLEDSDTATIKFFANTAAGFAFVGGAGRPAMHAVGVVVKTPPGPAGVTPTIVSPTAGFIGFMADHMGDQGPMGVIADYMDSTPISKIVFTLTNDSGTWGSASDVLALNTTGRDAAAHILVLANPSITGFAGEGRSGFGAPDSGATVMLLGAALGALGMARRFLKF
jgi:VPDSG-CTERM motif